MIMARFLKRRHCVVHVALAFIPRPVLDCETKLEALLGNCDIIMIADLHLRHLVRLASLLIARNKYDEGVTFLLPWTIFVSSLQHIDLDHER